MRDLCDCLGITIVVSAIIFSVVSFMAGATDANPIGLDRLSSCSYSTAPIKKYNPVYLGTCWLFGEKEPHELSR